MFEFLMNTKFLPFQVEFSNLSPGRVKINSFDIKQGFVLV